MNSRNLAWLVPGLLALRGAPAVPETPLTTGASVTTTATDDEPGPGEPGATRWEIYA